MGFNSTFKGLVFATDHEPVLTTFTPAQNVIQSGEITRFCHHKQRLSCLKVSVVYRNKTKHITETDLYYASLILYFLISMYLSTKLCGPDTNFYFQLLQRSWFLCPYMFRLPTVAFIRKLQYYKNTSRVSCIDKW